MEGFCAQEGQSHINFWGTLYEGAAKRCPLQLHQDISSIIVQVLHCQDEMMAKASGHAVPR